MARREWSNLNINPVIGCYTGCEYCYGRRLAKWANKFRRPHCKLCDEFIPHPHFENLDKLTPGQKPRFVFLDGFYDWNGKGVKKQWLEVVLAKTRECPQHTFPILSKFPERYGRFTYPLNVILGVTVTNEGKHTLREMSENPRETKDWRRITTLKRFKKSRKCISFEPLLGPLPNNISLKGIDWVIVGALSRSNRKRIQPKLEWVRDIVTRAQRYKIPIFLKGSLDIKGLKMIQEYPRAT